MKHRFILIACLLWAWGASPAQTLKPNQLYRQYFDQYKDVAIEQMLDYGIPASITLAQGVLESGAGQSELAKKGKNHFGIKCSNGWTGRTTYHNDDMENECFRAYGSVYESYVDHSRFLSQSKRYSALFQLKKTDYKGWARGLKAAGYATSPTYATKLIEIIELYGLHQYDKLTSYDRRLADIVRQGSAYQIHVFNQNEYVVARQGDTYRSIGASLGMSYKALAKYNENTRDAQLRQGDIVWLKKKRTKAPKEYKGKTYRVTANDSMYSIAQRYGIRIKSLYKLNGLQPDYVLRVGDQLILR